MHANFMKILYSQGFSKNRSQKTLSYNPTFVRFSAFLV
jgi:hypothetical protein